MKKIILLMLALGMLGCISDKKTTNSTTEDETLNTDVIGFYQYHSREESENHYIVIDTINGTYTGLYFGTQDSGGHGVFFYENDMENLKSENNTISFEIGVRKLYETSRFRIFKHAIDSENDAISGATSDVLKYSGAIVNGGFTLNCESASGYCWENELRFEELTEKI